MSFSPNELQSFSNTRLRGESSFQKEAVNKLIRRLHEASQAEAKKRLPAKAAPLGNVSTSPATTAETAVAPSKPIATPPMNPIPPSISPAEDALSTLLSKLLYRG